SISCRRIRWGGRINCRISCWQAVPVRCIADIQGSVKIAGWRSEVEVCAPASLSINILPRVSRRFLVKAATDQVAAMITSSRDRHLRIHYWCCAPDEGFLPVRVPVSAPVAIHIMIIGAWYHAVIAEGFSSHRQVLFGIK